MALDDRDKSIIAQVAVKETVNLLGSVCQGQEPGYVASLVPDIAPTIHQTILTLFNGEQLQEAFPGSTVQNQDTTNVVPHPAAQQVQAPNQPQQPAPIPGAGDPDDVWWQDLMNNPGDWWDNRTDKRNPKAPDFKHKQKKRNPGDQYPVGLYMDKAPAWFQYRG